MMKREWYVIADWNRKHCQIICHTEVENCSVSCVNHTRRLTTLSPIAEDTYIHCCSIGRQLAEDGSNWRYLSNSELLLVTARCKDESIREYLKKILKEKIK